MNQRRTNADDAPVSRKEFTAFCDEMRIRAARTEWAIAERDATIARLLTLLDTGQQGASASPAAKSADKLPDNWQPVCEVMWITDRKHSTVLKWVRQKKIVALQPGGPRTAIVIDVDSIPRAWVRRSAKNRAGRTID